MANRKWEDEDAPRKIVAKFNGHCAECETDLKEGDDIIYDPKTRKAYCTSCGGDL